MPTLPNFQLEVANEIASQVLSNGRLDCPNCGVVAIPHCLYPAQTQESGRIRYEMLIVTCAACAQRTVFVLEQKGVFMPSTPIKWETVWHKVVYPVGRFQKPFPNTDKKYLKPYRAACETLTVSPEAAATMARRCLQTMLSDQGYAGNNLHGQITALLAETDRRKQLPVALHNTVDAIRNFGNFGAHPINDQTTLQIVDIDPGEAEWCIEIIEELFDFYFEKPARSQAKIAAANSKLAIAGKPPLRS
jgi:hypothetical protein